MRIQKSTSIAMLVAVAVGVAGLQSVASADAPTAVTVITPAADRNCAGDTNTITWSPPSGSPSLLRYRVVRSVTTMNPPWTDAVEVGADQTSLSFEALFGWTIVNVYAVMAEGVAPTLIASGSVFAGRPPQPMRWAIEGSNVGDHVATATFRWPGPIKLFTTGGLENTVRVTAAPTGRSVDLPPLNNGVAATFGGLTNGVAYTFTAVTSNACGSIGSESSPPFTPGIAPSWARNSPPLDATHGNYVYKFAAQGDPSPTYRLAGAPSWLTVSPVGLVAGSPPDGTSSFSYSVVASNGAGIGFFQNTAVVAGPFTVSVRSPKSTGA